VGPERQAVLAQFVNQPYKGMRHKFKPAHSSNSEDSLTWSCFDTLKWLSADLRATALAFLWDLTFDEPMPKDFAAGEIEIGKTFGDSTAETEVDASIESDSVLLFIEAKLYQPIKMSDRSRTHDQLAHKIRVGLREAQRRDKSFYLVVLDIAPLESLRSIKPAARLEDAETTQSSGFGKKWLTAYWFSRYKGGVSVTPLKNAIKDIPGADATRMARCMGWLTWADLFKIVLRASVGEIERGRANRQSQSFR
jgi:hypothetical protein